MPFRAKLKVCFGDIDNAGIVYYPRFVHYFHVALEDFFIAELGIEYATVFQKHRLAFPTVHLSTDFCRRLHFGDHIEVQVEVRDLGRTSVTWGYKVYLSGGTEDPVAQGYNVTVCVDPGSFEKQVVPTWLRSKLEDYQGRCNQGT